MWLYRFMSYESRSTLPSLGIEVSRSRLWPTAVWLAAWNNKGVTQMCVRMPCVLTVLTHLQTKWAIKICIWRLQRIKQLSKSSAITRNLHYETLLATAGSNPVVRSVGQRCCRQRPPIELNRWRRQLQVIPDKDERLSHAKPSGIWSPNPGTPWELLILPCLVWQSASNKISFLNIIHIIQPH